MPLQLPPRDAGSDSPSAVRQFARQIAQAVSRLAAGQSNATGSVTLTANAATTTVTDARMGAASVVLFDPTTANAATELAAGTMRVSTRAGGSFTITHANNAQTDRTFKFLIQG